MYNSPTDYQLNDKSATLLHSPAMPNDYPAALLGRLSFLLGKLYFRSLDLENLELGRLGVHAIGVKHQAVLMVLIDEGPMSQQELGHRLGIDRTTIVGLVDDLEDEQLVERGRRPQDRRQVLLTLTTRGRRIGQRGHRLVEAAQDKLLEALNEEDRRTLIRLLAQALTGP